MLLKPVFDAIKKRNQSRLAIKSAMIGDFDKSLELIRGGANPNYSMTYELQAPVDSYPIAANVGRAAVARNNVKVLGELLELGLDKNLKLGRHKLPLLYYAVESKSEDAALFLISKGAAIGEDSGYHSVAGIAREFRLTRVLAAIEQKRQAESITKRAAPLQETVTAAPAPVQ